MRQLTDVDKARLKKIFMDRFFSGFGNEPFELGVWGLSGDLIELVNEKISRASDIDALINELHTVERNVIPSVQIDMNTNNSVVDELRKIFADFNSEVRDFFEKSEAGLERAGASVDGKGLSASGDLPPNVRSLDDFRKRR